MSWEKILFNPAKPEPTAAPPVLAKPNTRPASSDPTLKKRARSKWMSYHIASELANLNSPLKKSYIRTLHCGETITKVGDKLTSAYCGNRWCLVCSRIRTGKLMNSYLDLSASLQDKHFVTLTVRNVTTVGRTDKEIIAELRHYQKQMFKWCRKTLDGLRKYDLLYKGIRNFENKPSEDRKGFRPHIHWCIDGTCDVNVIEKIWQKKKLSRSKWLDLVLKLDAGTITPGYVKGELLIQLWLKEFKGVTDRKGQQVKPCTPGTEKELFKYETKFTIGKGNEKSIPVRMLDMIYQATRNVRTVTITGYITRKPTAPKKGTLETDVRNLLVTTLNQMKIEGIDRKDPEFFQQAMRKVKEHDLIVNDADANLLYEMRQKIFEEKIEQWILYRTITKKLEEEITEDLEAQEYTGQIDSDIYEWRHDNWYSIHTSQPLVKWDITKRFANFLTLFDSS